MLVLDVDISLERDISVFFKNNLVNFHGSRLPYDAGAGHFSWRIMKGDKNRKSISTSYK